MVVFSKRQCPHHVADHGWLHGWLSYPAGSCDEHLVQTRIHHLGCGRCRRQGRANGRRHGGGGKVAGRWRIARCHRAAPGHALRLGHNLLWQKSKYLPDWLRSYPLGTHPRVALERLLRDRVSREVEHYPQAVSWDVVNETISTDTGEVRETLFTRHLGLEAFDITSLAPALLTPSSSTTIT
jgi:hypothetical protein